MSVPSPAPTSRRRRRTFEDLVREVSAILNDPDRRNRMIGEVAEDLGQHPLRIVDALETCQMLARL